MKTFAKYILCSLLAAAAAACVNDPTVDGNGPDTPTDPDGEVTLRFAVQFPEPLSADTRAFGDKPTYTDLDLWCIVFIEDEQGIFLSESRKATHGTNDMPNLEGDGGPLGDGTLVPFEVTLSSTQQDAIIHFIAIDKTIPDDKNPILNGTLNYGPENVVIPRLTTLRTDDGVCHDAYWQRIPLGCRISMDNQDEINELISIWSPVPMIRNFVKISIELSGELKNKVATVNGVPHPWFELEGFYVVNKLTKGTIAPYTETSGFPEFVRLRDRVNLAGEKTNDDEQDIYCRPKNYWEITDPETYYKPKYNPGSEENIRPYYGTRPADWKPFDTDIPDYSATVYSPEGAAAYIYERPFSEDYHTFIVVAGRYWGNANAVQGTGELTYYKLDIGQPDDRGVFQFYHLLRNFHYKMVITDVEANGYASAQAAANGLIYNNNLSASVEAQHLLSISDGHDMMYINTTSLVIVNEEPFYLRYRYFLINDNSLDNDDQIFADDIRGVDENGWRYAERHTYTSAGTTLDRTPVGADELDSGGNKLRAVVWDDPKDGCVRGPVISSATRESTGTNENTYFIDTIYQGTTMVRRIWEQIKIVPNTPTTAQREQKVTIYRPHGLSRSVMLYLRSPWELQNLAVYAGQITHRENWPSNESGGTPAREGVVSQEVGKNLTLFIELPYGLPPAMFPLQFVIESDRQNIENDKTGTIVVQSGRSIIPRDSLGLAQNAELPVRIQYVKTVTWQEYDPDNNSYDPDNHDDNYDRSGDYIGHIVRCRFLTITDQRADNIDEENKTRLWISNPYFNLASTQFERVPDGEAPDYGDGEERD